MNTMEFEIKNVHPFETEPRDFNIKWNNIDSVYKGQLNSCSCGCSGEYLYTQHYADYRANTDGNKLLLDVSSDEVDEKIKRIIQYFATDKGVNKGYQRDTDGIIFEVETHQKDGKTFGYRIYHKNKPYNA